MQDAVRLANMDGGKTMDHSAAIGMRLSLGGNKTLTIGEKDLVLFGMETLERISRLRQGCLHFRCVALVADS